jgi:hypothetical protein
MIALSIGSGIQTIQQWMVASIGVGDSLAFLMTAVICVAVASVVSVGVMTLVWRYRRVLLRGRNLRLDKFMAPALPGINLFNALRIPVPKFSFDLSGFRGIGFALGVVAVGFALAFSFVIVATDDTPMWPEAGAAYALPSTIGTPLDPDPETPEEKSQTLLIGLKNNTRIDRLKLSGLDLGKASLAKSFEIRRNPTTGVTGATAYLFIGDIVVTDSSAPALNFHNMQIGSITLAPRTDGHTNEIQQDSTVAQVIVDSDRGSGSVEVIGSKVDRVIIQLNGVLGASIGVLEISDVDSSVGSWDWGYIRAGSMSISASNEYGSGSGINDADAIWQSSISARTIVDNTVDVPISVR